MVKLKDVKEQKSFGTKPVGWYQVEIHKAESKTSSKGTPFYNFWMKIVDGEFKGQYIFCPIYLSAKAIGFLKPFLKAVEFSDEYEIIIDEDQIIIPIMEFEKHQQLMVLIDHVKNDKGEVQEKAVAYRSLVEEGKQRIEFDDEVPF